MKTIRPNAAAGPDDFPAVLLRCIEKLETPLQILYNYSLQTGVLLKLMKSARETPVYKKGLRRLVPNNLPMALTSHIT